VADQGCPVLIYKRLGMRRLADSERESERDCEGARVLFQAQDDQDALVDAMELRSKPELILDPGDRTVSSRLPFPKS